jgi:hypothetical protein
MRDESLWEAGSKGFIGDYGTRKCFAVRVVCVLHSLRDWFNFGVNGGIMTPFTPKN